MKNKIINLLKNIRSSARNLLFQTAPFVPLAPMDAQPGSKLAGLYANPNGDLSTYVSTLFTFAISLGAIIAVVRLMWAGYLYMGGDLIGNKAKAKEVFSNVIVGLALLLAIYLILQKINPNLLNIQVLTNIKNTPSTGQQAPAGTKTQGTMTCTNCAPPGGYCDQRTGVCLVQPN